jgi:hypothetical protein
MPSNLLKMDASRKGKGSIFLGSISKKIIRRKKIFQRKLMGSEYRGITIQTVFPFFLKKIKNKKLYNKKSVVRSTTFWYKWGN